MVEWIETLSPRSAASIRRWHYSNYSPRPGPTVWRYVTWSRPAGSTRPQHTARCRHCSIAASPSKTPISATDWVRAQPFWWNGSSAKRTCRHLFRPTLLAICQEVQELVHLGILEGRNVLYLDKVEPDRTLRVWSRVGRQVSVLTTALGRAMVAGEGTPDSLLSAYTTDADATVAKRFRRAVGEAQLHGFATEREENEAGICCVGVALRRSTGRPVAVSITGPSTRMGAGRLDDLGRRLREVLQASAPPGFTVAPPAESTDDLYG